MEDKERAMRAMVENQFSIADIIFVLDVIGDRLAHSSNLSMKQVDLLPVIKALSLSGSFLVNEDSFNTVLSTLMMHAASRDISQTDVIVALMYSLLEIMHSICILTSDDFVEVRKEIREKITDKTMFEWLESKLDVVPISSVDELYDRMKETIGCDGDCDSCDRKEEHHPEEKDDNKPEVPTSGKVTSGKKNIH